MITLIYGGSGSGKSEFAENLVCLGNYRKKYYLATMNASDLESKKRIDKHRAGRSGKGFITLEQANDISKVIPRIEEVDLGDFSTKEDSNSVILLECMSNLLSNEMFRDGKINSSDYCTKKITKDIKELESKVDCLVIVTNNIFEDGLTYDPATEEYLKALGDINKLLSKMADTVYEVVVGIGIKQ